MPKKKNYKKAYEKIISAQEPVGTIKKKNERRYSPRLKVDTTELSISVTLAVSTINVSADGISFYSLHAFQIGQVFNIHLGKVFSLQAEVVACEVEEIDPELLEMRYRVHCRYTEPEGGVELLVLLKDMGQNDPDENTED
ncbi:MAG: PilZ domain-containing protein [Deltaproteobacteria bacterium]|nr:PilZ domain-containing protein [Deltaproteobacteria bacterium]